MDQLNLFTFLGVTGWATHAVINLVSKQRRSISLVVLLFYFFYGLPLLWDLLFGPPQYFMFPGFREPAWSSQVAIVYDLFVLVCPLFWWLTAPRGRIPSSRVPDLAGLRRIRLVLWAVMILPLVALAFAPDPGFYAHYGAVLGPEFSTSIAQYHAVLGAACLFAMFAAFTLLISQPRVKWTFAAVLPFFILACWLIGKRSGVFLAVVLVWIAFWIRGTIRFHRLVAGGIATLLLLAFYSTSYQVALRPTAALGPDIAYETTRIDYGREHNFRLALYCELTHSRRILSYRGESIVFYLTMAVPRSVWPEKPLNYATYMASAALLTKPRFLGWSVTTSVLDEAVANFSWFGLLIGPAVLALICRIGDKSDPLGKALAVLIACVLLALEITPFAPLIVCWGLYLGWSRWSVQARRQRRPVRYAPVEIGPHGSESL